MTIRQRRHLSGIVLAAAVILHLCFFKWRFRPRWGGWRDLERADAFGIWPIESVAWEDALFFGVMLPATLIGAAALLWLHWFPARRGTGKS